MVRLGLCSFLLVAYWIKGGFGSEDNAGNTYFNNGEFYTDPGLPISPSNSILAGQSYPSCLTLSLVVYYDRYFKDGLGGNTASGSVARVENILDIAKDTIHVFTPDGSAWEATEIQLDIQGIDFADVVYEAGGSSIVTPIMASDTRSPDVFLFLTWQNDTSGLVGTNGGKPICSSAQPFHIAEARSTDSYSGNLVGAHQLGLNQLKMKEFDEYFKANQPFCLEECECCSNCTSVTCSDMMDTYNQPYECVPEDVAQNWHKECMQPQNRGQKEDLCRYDGPVEQCVWTDWIDDDGPIGQCDCEPVPDGCLVQEYEIRDLNEPGTVYTDVEDAGQILGITELGITCFNRDQPGCPTTLGGSVPPPPPIPEQCCKDYEVRFCCGPPPPKCNCCPPKDPAPKCEDKGCSQAFNGRGNCTRVTNPNWKELAKTHDLSEPFLEGLCESSDESCCSCLKTKTCKDTGCHNKFGGQGVCVDTVEGGLAKYDLDLSVEPDKTPGLCTNDINGNCCSCFKKKSTDPGCFKLPCNYIGLDGYCIGKTDPTPIGYMETDLKCDEEAHCKCWIACKDRWSKNKCKKAKKKGDCTKPEVAANCCQMCGTVKRWN